MSLLTIPTHSCTYSAAFSPHDPNTMSCVSSDSHLRVYDLRTPASTPNHLTMQIPIHQSPQANLPAPGGKIPFSTPPSEALTHDWNKYRPTIVATAGVDRTIRTFDIRAPNQGPIVQLLGHEYAVRRLTWSPHLPDLLLSASYDMTVRAWTDGFKGAGGDEDALRGGVMPMGREVGRMGRHTEFATGVDWCLFGSEGWCASTGWDERVLVWDVRAVMQ